MDKTSNGSDKQKQTFEAKRWCHGDRQWTNWQPCTEAEAALYRKDENFKVRPRST